MGSTHYTVTMRDPEQIVDAARQTEIPSQSSYGATSENSMSFIRTTYEFTSKACKILRRMVAKLAEARQSTPKTSKRCAELISRELCD